tara:strand:- start:1933 stop:2229 length:297 start_codon:yes stop_codon:yes gene_type:complete
MIYYVTRMRHKGRPLTPQQLQKAERVRCNIGVNHESNILGRSSVVARTAGHAGPLDTPPLPELLDVTLHSMASNAMVLSGIEQVDGVSYAQSWICRQE